jgi:hypothetical protein
MTPSLVNGQPRHGQREVRHPIPAERSGFERSKA